MSRSTKSRVQTIEESLKKVQTITALTKEHEAGEQCKGLVQEAFLGTAQLDISMGNSRVALRFRTYNPGREIQEDLLRSMVERMKLGQCSSASNPLIVAVDLAMVNTESLTICDANQTQPEGLKKVIFNTSAPVSLELLAGMHRVKAARIASEQLRARFRKLDQRLSTQPNPEAFPPEQGENDPLLFALRDELAVVKNVIELVEHWPVHFYDIGKLRSLSKGLPQRIKAIKGHDALLSFLAENSSDGSAPKTSAETFTEIIGRYLYSPGPAKRWNHLIVAKRILETICLREPTWNLATTAISVSPDIHRCWVVQADSLFEVASSPSSKLICSVTTHILKRFLLLFAPVEAPAAGQKAWLESKELCEGWAEGQRSRLQQWKQLQPELMRGTGANYSKGMEDVLRDLVNVGREANKSITDLEGLFRPTDRTIQVVSRQGFDISKEQLSSHVYVTSSVMTQLDEIYLRHYGTDEPSPLVRCFSMMGASRASVDFRRKYQDYLDEVRRTLDKLSSSPTTAVALEQHDLHAFGLKHAANKLEPLFGPLFGRICLPLPTRSMLRDLKVCLEINKDIMSEVGRWLNGLGEHIMGVKGHESNVHTWSEAMALRLRSLCSLQTESKQEELILLAFSSIMRYAPRFDNLRSELAQSGSIRSEKQRLELLSNTAAVQGLAKEIKNRITRVKELKQITLLDSDSIQWSLILSSGYNVTQAAVKKSAPSKLCCRVVHETAQQVIDSRTKLLHFPYAAFLRSRLWFDVNCWFAWNPSGLPDGRPVFRYWDRVPDQPPFMPSFYEGEKVKKIQQLFSEDLKRFGELGDFLASCPALCNNPDALGKDRIISGEMKQAIDRLLFVAAERLNEQRLLACPPDEPEREEGENLFLYTPPYVYSQATFKTFSEEEIRSQAGKEVLPPGAEGANLERNSSQFKIEGDGQALSLSLDGGRFRRSQVRAETPDNSSIGRDRRPYRSINRGRCGDQPVDFGSTQDLSQGTEQRDARKPSFGDHQDHDGRLFRRQGSNLNLRSSLEPSNSSALDRTRRKGKGKEREPATEGEPQEDQFPLEPPPPAQALRRYSTLSKSSSADAGSMAGLCASDDEEVSVGGAIGLGATAGPSSIGRPEGLLVNIADGKPGAVTNGRPLETNKTLKRARASSDVLQEGETSSPNVSQSHMGLREPREEEGPNRWMNPPPQKKGKIQREVIQSLGPDGMLRALRPPKWKGQAGTQTKGQAGTQTKSQNASAPSQQNSRHQDEDIDDDMESLYASEDPVCPIPDSSYGSDHGVIKGD